VEVKKEEKEEGKKRDGDVWKGRDSVDGEDECEGPEGAVDAEWSPFC
jgi:hypothetical protein